MRLGDYLRMKRMSHDDFATAIGRTRTSVTRYVNGQRMPRPAVLLKIEHETGGQVTANDFIGAPPETTETDAAA